eukprot:snap_masked-scaffold_99-processed-gene-0.8-mRNA-1 protein AED:1.00 eAED:1.00 QI:0/0/0/0/1/1/4/0/79
MEKKTIELQYQKRKNNNRFEIDGSFKDYKELNKEFECFLKGIQIDSEVTEISFWNCYFSDIDKQIKNIFFIFPNFIVVK